MICLFFNDILFLPHSSQIPGSNVHSVLVCDDLPRSIVEEGCALTSGLSPSPFLGYARSAELKPQALHGSNTAGAHSARC